MWKRFKTAWALTKFISYLKEAEDASFWGREDAVWLNQQLNSHYGQKFLIKLRNHSIQLALNAVMNPNTQQFSNGIAAGSLITISNIEKLSQFGAIPEHADSDEAASEFESTAAF